MRATKLKLQHKDKAVNLLSNLDNGITHYSDVDLQRKFQNSYFLLKDCETGMPFVGRIEMFPANGNEVVISRKVLQKDRVGIIQEVPENGIYNHGKGVVLFSRLGARQYTRGLHDGMCRVFLDTRIASRVTSDLATNLFLPSEPVATWKQAYLILQKDPTITGLVCGTSREYWVRRQADKFYLLRKELVVGEIHQNGVTLHPWCDCLKVELNDDVGAV